MSDGGLASRVDVAKLAVCYRRTELHTQNLLYGGKLVTEIHLRSSSLLHPPDEQFGNVKCNNGT